MIVERSSAGEEDSYMEDNQRRRGLDLLGTQENISLVEEDYMIVDRQRMSFFEERLQAMEALEVRSPSPRKPALPFSSPMNDLSGVQLHVSQLDAAGLTENSDEELEDEDEAETQSQASVDHFHIDANLTEPEP